MATASNNRPKAPSAPVISVRDQGYSDNRRLMFMLLPAALVSVLFHGGLLGLFMLLAPPAREADKIEASKDETVVENREEEKKNPLLTSDVDPANQEFDTDIQYNVPRIADVSVPGSVDPNEAVGIKDGAKDMPPTNLPAPGGFGAVGQGGALETNTGPTTSMAAGETGGYGPRGLPLSGTFYGRSGATREQALRNGGGTTESEACVNRGLQWLLRVQMQDGRWSFDHPAFKNEKGNINDDVAATALGLLPFLAAGKTHKAGKENPFDKPIEKGLLFILRRQDRKDGYLSDRASQHGIYGHGLATIVLCETYGLTQDPNFRRPAQMAINYIIQNQHEGGGWRYHPGEAGDLSVSGWMVMALKSGLMAGLDVPAVTLRKAQSFLQASCDADKSEGYKYTPDGGPSPTMTAVGLLARQYLQSWGPQNLRMITAVDNYIKTNPPTTKNAYYYYYATQVMHHFGGQAWKNWNEQMRDILVKSQEKTTNTPNSGSWSSAGDPWAGSGGRLMVTSLNLLTLEVYYRYLPLYYREAAAKADPVIK